MISYMHPLRPSFQFIVSSRFCIMRLGYQVRITLWLRLQTLQRFLFFLNRSVQYESEITVKVWVILWGCKYLLWDRCWCWNTEKRSFCTFCSAVPHIIRMMPPEEIPEGCTMITITQPLTCYSRSTCTDHCFQREHKWLWALSSLWL